MQQDSQKHMKSASLLMVAHVESSYLYKHVSGSHSELTAKLQENLTDNNSFVFHRQKF